MRIENDIYHRSYVDTTGKEVISLEGYGAGSPFSEGLARVSHNNEYGYNKVGFIDKTGKLVISTPYEDAGNFSEGLAWVSLRETNEHGGWISTKYGAINQAGDVVIPIQYDGIGDFSEGLAQVLVDGKTGFMDTTGNIVISPVYSSVSDFGEFADGIAAVAKPAGLALSLGYIDKTGREVLDASYAGIGSLSEGLRAVKDYVGWCYMDKDFNVVLKSKYKDAGMFSGGMAAVSNQDGKYGYIDTSGNTVIPFTYDYAGTFSDGYAPVEKDGKRGYIDTSGNVVIPLEYDVSEADFGYSPPSLTGAGGYYYRGELANGLAIVRKDGRYGILNVNATAPAPTQPTPSTPEPSAPDTGAVLSSQKLTVDGKEIDCEKYNIGGSNYFKLRDLAQLLNGTASQFGVGYDNATSTVTITTGEAYTPTGTEMATGVDNSSTAKPSSQTIKINGVEHGELTVYNIGGSNFFQLRELGNVLGFEVGYDQATNTATVTSK